MPENEERPLALDREHAAACHARWIIRRNNVRPDQEPETLPDEWYNDQCGQCRYFVPLTGPLGGDWGVCTNARSPFDRQAMFEHDGCVHYASAGDWVSSSLP